MKNLNSKVALASALKTSAKVKNDTEAIQVADRIMAGQSFFQDRTVYATKSASAVTTIKMFETETRKEIGLTNIDGAKLDKNVNFAVTAIQLLAVDCGAAPTATLMKQGNYGSIKTFTSLQNGEFSMTIANEKVLDKISTSIFVSEASTDRPTGLYALEAPILIKAQDTIEMFIELGTATPANTAVKVVLWGAATSM